MLFVVVLVGLLLWMKSRSEGGVVSPRDLTIFYSIFVMLQFWNIFNARRFGDSRSAFSGLGDNMLFVIIAISIFAGQVLIVQFGGTVFRTVPLSLMDWLMVVGCTAPVMLIGECGRLIRRSRRGSAV